jgi:hypothetical protein
LKPRIATWSCRREPPSFWCWSNRSSRNRKKRKREKKSVSGTGKSDDFPLTAYALLCPLTLFF